MRFFSYGAKGLIRQKAFELTSFAISCVSIHTHSLRLSGVVLSRCKVSAYRERQTK